jgi:hypothetical protein
VLLKKESLIFNLWDTNGRRSDVLNALTIYLSIIQKLTVENPGIKWANYPKSFMQYEFYIRAVAASPEVFSNHKNYDEFRSMILPYLELFRSKDSSFLKSKIGKEILKIMDQNIENRARFYTNNLVKFGFATKKRKITPVGNEYLNNKIVRDDIEKILPLKTANIILLRQLMKLRIYHKSSDDSYEYYSPFYMAIYLLLNYEKIDNSTFKNIVQGISPKMSQDLKNQLIGDELELFQKENLMTSTTFEIINDLKVRN